MCIYQRLEAEFDDEDLPTATQLRRREGRTTWQDIDPNLHRESHESPRQREPQREPNEQNETTTEQLYAEDGSTFVPDSPEPPDEDVHATTPSEDSPTVSLRRSTRERSAPSVLSYDHGWVQGSSPRTNYASWQPQPGSYSRAIGFLMMLEPDHDVRDVMYLCSLYTDLHTGFMEQAHPTMVAYPSAFKAKKKKYDPDTPSMFEALTGQHSGEFRKAMDKEIQALEGMGTWKIVKRTELPKGSNIIPGTWAFRIKRYPDGRLQKFKARFCVQGFRERKEDIGDTYAPVVGWPTIRAMLVMAATLDLYTVQVDWISAFCQAPQTSLVFVELPQHYKVNGREDEDLVLQLEKGLYGQSSAPKLFWDYAREALMANEFVPSDSDPCLFIHKDMISVLYVDDQIFCGKDKSKIHAMIKKMKADGYQLDEEEVEEDVYAFLGINIKRDGGKVTLSQPGLTKKFLETVKMTDCSVASTPANLHPLGADKNGKPFNEDWSYPSAVGQLLYLSSNSRPDIQFAVHQCTRFTHNPKHSHAQAVKRIACYLKGTADKGLIMTPDTSQGLDCHCDADFCGLWGHEDDQDPVCVRSRTGYVLRLFGCPLLWSSRLQSEITLSTVAAEYVAFSMAMRDLLPMRELLKEIGSALGQEVKQVSEMRSTVFEDNTGCLSLVNTPRMSTRNKYLALKYHWFRSKIGTGPDQGVIAVHVDTKKQLADGFTKGLPEAQFIVLRKMLMGW